MSSFYMPLNRTTSIELVMNDETEDLDYVVIEGRKYYSYELFSPLAIFFIDCIHKQIDMIKNCEVSDISKLNELEFISSKTNRKVTL